MRAEHFVLQQQQNLGRRFGTSKMHLSPPVAQAAVRSLGGGSVVFDFLFIVTPIVGVCYCSMFCCTLHYVHSSIAIILIGKRELVALLNLSSWCLMVVERLFLGVPRGCLRFVIVVFPDHTHLLFCLEPISSICLPSVGYNTAYYLRNASDYKNMHSNTQQYYNSFL